MAQLNARLNGVEDRVTLVQRAVSDRAGSSTVRRHLESPATSSIVSGALPWESIEDSNRVQVVVPRDALAELGIKKVFLIKLDVEGSELPALLGLGKGGLAALGVRFDFDFCLWLSSFSRTCSEPMTATQRTFCSFSWTKASSSTRLTD